MPRFPIFRFQVRRPLRPHAAVAPYNGESVPAHQRRRAERRCADRHRAGFALILFLLGIAFAWGSPLAAQDGAEGAAPGDASESPASETRASEAGGAEAGSEEAKEGAKDEHRPLFYLRNASRIAGVPKMAAIHLQTKYGKLRVPVKDILMLRFAERLTEEDREAAAEAVKSLVDEDEGARKAARQTLKKLGAPVLPTLRKSLRSKSEKLQPIAQSLYDDIRKAALKEASRAAELRPLIDGDDDEIVLDGYTLRGRIEEDAYTIDSEYGTLNVLRADLVGIIFQQSTQADVKLKVDATRNTIPAGWVRTKINFTQGLTLRVKATGVVHQPNYGVSGGPDGIRGYTNTAFPGMPSLALVAKIGKGGKPFVVGADYKAKPKRSGTLFFGIVPFRRNYVSSGTYEVKVSVAP